MLSESDVTIYGGQVNITGSLRAPNESISFLERCTTSSSVGIGGTGHPPEEMSLTRDELSRLTAENITFATHQGHMTIYGVDHDSDMNAIGDYVHLFSNQTITFTSHDTFFRQVHANAELGMNVHTNINATRGDLTFVYPYGDLLLNEVEISAEIISIK